MKSILIQARMSSKRFPGKMLLPIFENLPLVEFVYKRCLAAKQADIVAVITSEHQSDNGLYDYCAGHGINAFRGSLDNVLNRYVKAAEYFNTNVICRVCGDSPFVDTELIDKMFKIQAQGALDYVAVDKSSCIAGLDSEIVTLAALRKSLNAGPSSDEAEHVTLYLKNNIKDFRMKFLNVDLRPAGLAGVSLTVDAPKDLEFCRKIAERLPRTYSFRTEEIFDFLSERSRNVRS